MTDVLEKPVLVLDKTYSPAYVTTVREALNTLFLDKAKVLDKNWNHYNMLDWITLDPENQEKINSPRLKCPRPRVIVTPDYFDKEGKKKDAKYSRIAVFRRDNWTCQYCGKKGSRSSLTIDHVHPKSKGGENTFENTVAACVKCNSAKGDKSIEELAKAGKMKLMKRPTSPDLRSFIKNTYKEDYEEYWSTFV